MVAVLELFAFTVSGLVGVLLIVWWWADGRGDDGCSAPAQTPDAPRDSVPR